MHKKITPTLWQHLFRILRLQHLLETQKKPSCKKKMKARCQCGNIAFEISRSEPLEVYYCHCNECRLQSSSAFGTSAIFPTQDIRPHLEERRDKLSVWTRPSKTGGTMHCFFCPICGTRIAHMTILPDGSAMSTTSVKGGCLEALDTSNVHHIYARNAVVSVPADATPGSPSEE